MRVDILSLFPGYFRGPFDESIIRRARESGLVEIVLWDLRDFSKDPRKRVDDRPYGGGPGMVMMAQPVVDAVRALRRDRSHVIYLSPQGSVLDAKKSRSLAQHTHLILLCGHYEGVDQRALELVVDEEVSIGDFVLTSGAPAAIVLLDALLRFIPGVLGHPDAANEDSFEEGRTFDCPHYTRPPSFEGKEVPPILLSGDHAKIDHWRREQGDLKYRLRICNEGNKS